MAEAPVTQKRMALNMKASPHLRARIEAAAQDSGLSIAQEVERRLIASFDYQDAVDYLRQHFPAPGSFTPAPKPKLLTASQAAPKIGVSEGTLANWRVQGFGPKFIRSGSRISYDPADIEAWKASRRVGSTSEYR